MLQEPATLRASVTLLLVTVAVVGSNSLSLGPIAPDVAAGTDSSVQEVLRASAAYGIGTAFSAFFLARYIDRIGVRITLVRASGLLCVSMMASALAATAVWLSLAQLSAGIAAGVALPCCYAGAAAIAPPGQQNRILGMVLAGWTVSMVAGVGLAALIADHADWRTVYWLLAVLSGLTWFGTTRSSLPDQRSHKSVDNPLTALSAPGVPMLLFLVVCYMVAFYGVYNFVGDYVVTALNKSISANAWLTVAYGLGFGFAASFASMLDRLAASSAKDVSGVIRPQHFPMIALLGLVVVYLTLGLVSASFVLLIPAAALWGLVNHLALNVLVAALNAADDTRRGSVMGLYSCVTYLSLSAGTLLFGLIYNGTAILELCLLSAAICLGAAIIGYFWSGRKNAGLQE